MPRRTEPDAVALARSHQFARAVLRQIHPTVAPSSSDVALVALGMRMYAGQEAAVARARHDLPARRRRTRECAAQALQRRLHSRAGERSAPDGD